MLLIGAGVGAWSATHTLGVASGWIIAATVPLLAVASVALFVPRRRVLNFTLFAVVTIVVCVIAFQPARPFANRDSVRDLLKLADARGYGSAPVFHFLSDERTAEFYAAGRLTYLPNGEPVRFEGAQLLPPAIREKSSNVGLVLMETRWERQLTDYKAVETERIASNELITIFAVRLR
jgi:hypothetical protein